MIITFYSNYYNHHQKSLCDALSEIEDVDFYFVETEPIEEFRKNMGWGQEKKPDYVISAYSSEELKYMALELAERSDLVIIGSAPEWYIEKRIEQNGLIFRYTERPMKEGWIKMFIPRLAKKFYHLHYRNRNKNIYVLGASAYAAYDYALLHSYRNKCLKFGYFPKAEELPLNEVMQKKGRTDRLNILWTGRFLRLKRADLLIKALGRLKKKGYDFSLLMVGNGEQENYLKQLSVKCDLSERVEFRDFVTPDEVRILMEEADIYCMTSNFLEGWGSVIYEALSAGCGVIASHACGCSPWLVRDGETGFLYRNGSVRSLEDRLERFFTDDTLLKKCQKGAYIQMNTLWNPKVAAERIVAFAKASLSGEAVVYEEGPLSLAPILKNSWYKD